MNVHAVLVGLVYVCEDPIFDAAILAALTHVLIRCEQDAQGRTELRLEILRSVSLGVLF